jgi:DNA-binding response OmpR family regulator
MKTTDTKLLLITSDEILAQVCSFRLELLGFQVTVVATGDAALTSINEDKPNLLLLDMEVQGLSAPALIEQLATDAKTAKIPILAISANADMEQVQRTITAGANDYLVVPFDLIVLEDKVTRLLQEAELAEKQDKQALAKA